MPKDLVAPKGDPLNDRERVYIDMGTNEQISLSIKKEAFNAGLRTALGWTDTPAPSKRVHKETQQEAIKDWGCIPVTLEYEDDGHTGYAKTVASPDADLKALIGQKYHGTLDITNYSIGHS